jgi:3',5'-cyclic AMP phosphodiesterase CpdA
VYALDTNCRAVGGCGRGSRQYRWLKADLAAHRTKCTLAVWHHPRYSSGSYGSTASRAFLRLLYQSGAELVVAGHEHIYERFAPIRPNGRRDLRHGIRQFIVGTGGAPHHGVTHPIAANSRVRTASTYGVLRLSLGRGRYSWRFVPVPGETFRDEGRATCHGAR